MKRTGGCGKNSYTGLPCGRKKLEVCWEKQEETEEHKEKGVLEWSKTTSGRNNKTAKILHDPVFLLEP